jgi:general secretion pathway protein F
MASRMITQLMYPVFLFHFAVLLFPMSLFTGLILNGGGAAFLKNKLAILLPVYGALLFFFWIVRADRNAAIRNVIERIALATPMVSGIRRCFSLARLCAALEALINAGVTIIEAWDLAARASGSPRLMRAVAEVRPRVVSGELPSEAIESQGVYPDLFVSSYKTGEVSGQLDEALRRLYRYYQEAATDGLNRFTEWLPRVIYMIVAIAIGYQVISFYSGYFNQINSLMGP